MKTLYQNLLGGKSGELGIALQALLITEPLPDSMAIVRTNMVAKNLTYAFVEVGSVLIWRYGGMISLGQAKLVGLRG